MEIATNDAQTTRIMKCSKSLLPVLEATRPIPVVSYHGSYHTIPSARYAIPNFAQSRFDKVFKLLEVNRGVVVLKEAKGPLIVLSQCAFSHDLEDLSPSGRPRPDTPSSADWLYVL